MRYGWTMMMAAAMAGCSASDRSEPARAAAPVSDEPITYSSGSCYGMCPVFTVTATPQGGTFHGGAFTAQPGEHRFALTPEQYRRFAAALAPFRPKGERLIADGSPDCGAAHTDDNSVNVTWGKGDRLALYYGCENVGLAEMKRVLSDATDLLPIRAFIMRR